MSQMNHMALVAAAALVACQTDDAVGSGFAVSTTTANSSTTDAEPEPADSSTSTGSSGGSGGASASGSSSSSSSSTAGTTTTGSTSTGGPGYCGDGIVDSPTEECEDGNDDPGDGCYVCLHARKVFVTSMRFKPDLGGLPGADSRCRQLANKAGLDRWETFNAWLSDSQQNAVDRIAVGKGPFVRVDGVVVADEGAKLLEGQLNVPIDIDEFGVEVTGNVWTGTRFDGTAIPGATHCADWTSDDHLSEVGYYGVSVVADSRWTFHEQPNTNPTPCNAEFRLYCVEGA